VRLLVAIVIWLAAIAGAAGVSSAVSNSIHPSVDATSITAAQPGSMFEADNFAKALTTIKGRLGANITTQQVVIYPGYVSVEADRGSSSVFAVLYAGGRWREDVSDGAASQSATFPLSQVSPSDPRALVAKLAQSSHVPASSLRYMVAQPDSASKGLRWVIYTSASSQPYIYTEANGHTEATSVPGAPAPTVPDPTAPTAPAQSGQQQLDKALKLAGCVQRAGTDIAKIQACQTKYGG
jgi:hypothetical protein